MFVEVDQVFFFSISHYQVIYNCEFLHGIRARFCRKISTWYQSKGDQGKTIYKKGEIQSLSFLNIEIEFLSHLYLTYGVQGLELEYTLDGSSNFIA